MKLQINGETVDVPESIRTVSDLLGHFGLDEKIVMAELNGDIVEKSSQGEQNLSDGDKIEIVHFVGGG